MFLGRIAPTLESRDPVALVESMLNQLPADARRVVVRFNGLDGNPVEGIREVARDLKMSREHVRSLLIIGAAHLEKIVSRLMTLPLEDHGSLVERHTGSWNGASGRHDSR